MENGTHTHTVDITGKTICLGDTVGYDFEKGRNLFTVVFEGNAFRKSYKGWYSKIDKPLLEYGENATALRFKIIKSYNQ